MLLYLANSKRPVDIDDNFKKGLTFLDMWNIEQGPPVVTIGAWCLMPNHFHILMKEIRVGGISTFMRTFSTAYSMYFNARYKRKGRLMQGSYQLQHIDNDRHLQYLFSYIHLNPIKLIEGESAWKLEGIRRIENAKEFLSCYPYSSLLDYMNSNRRPENKILRAGSFPWSFESVRSMEKELLEWLSLRGENQKG